MDGKPRNRKSMQYDPTGSYIAIAGILVSILGHFGVVVANNDVVGVIAAIATVYGIVSQFLAHRKLALKTGALK